MRRSLSASLLTALMTASLFAVGASAGDDRKKEGKSHPDFSGTWRLDRSKSDFGAFEDKPLAKADSTLVVEHRDAELKIRRTLSLNGQEEVKEFSYYTDERGETNQATLGVGEVKSKTRWDGDKVVSEAQIKRRGQGGPYTRRAPIIRAFSRSRSRSRRGRNQHSWAWGRPCTRWSPRRGSGRSAPS